MTNYARMYRFGVTPWERYRTVAAASIAALLDREEAERPRPLGRALDLGCGTGRHTAALAGRELRGANVHSPVQLHGVGVDDLAIQQLGQPQREP